MTKGDIFWIRDGGTKGRTFYPRGEPIQVKITGVIKFDGKEGCRQFEAIPLRKDLTKIDYWYWENEIFNPNPPERKVKSEIIGERVVQTPW